MAIPACERCRWHQHIDHQDELLAHLCTHPDAVLPDVIAGTRAQFCSLARSIISGVCGRAGRLFEEKPMTPTPEAAALMSWD